MNSISTAALFFSAFRLWVHSFWVWTDQQSSLGESVYFPFKPLFPFGFASLLFTLYYRKTEANVVVTQPTTVVHQLAILPSWRVKVVFRPSTASPHSGAAE
ncbi:hypothetical protein QBC35DRAFT_145932 [Podospora australis]|uniref:Uncharacterized protein n=1 Tax=Podospora australis TaxID=1536484 RepID=A0AAN6WW81_9PEZI|nr:hypothetical protein QBC35DRAFT_145932 [Podospora australis]